MAECTDCEAVRVELSWPDRKKRGQIGQNGGWGNLWDIFSL
jgi:hypothetical protein